MAAERGMPTARWNSCVGVSSRVEKPFSSRYLAASPTDWQQNGQAGVSKTAVTSSSRMRFAMGAIALPMNSSFFHWYP